jgi:ABC-2 type transport system ATP-binding protein
MLEAVNLTKRYEDGLLAVDHVSFKVEEGEIFCLLGANGAGKTTTINLFLNLIPATSGQALVGGVDVAREPLRAKPLLAYVSENVMLYGSLTAKQNLRFFAELAGNAPSRRNGTATYFETLLRRVGLQERAFDQKVEGFSKGMRQKLGIAVALAKKAPVLMLDEPTSGLDPKAASEFVRILEEIKAEGQTIFMSTHDVFRAKLVADKAGIMKDGHLVAMLDRSDIEQSDLNDLYLNYMAA